VCLYSNQKVNMACDLNFIDESEGFFKVKDIDIEVIF